MRRHIPYIMIVTLITLLISSAMAFAGTLNREKELHFGAWRDIAEKAAHIPRYKYALYASRSLAVKHPELYLQGDAIFNKLLVSLPNMALFYTAQHNDLGAFDGTFVDNLHSLPDLRQNRFDWNLVDLNTYYEIGYSELYGKAFLFPFLDLRLPLLGVSLLGWNNRATPLALAQMLYFRLLADKSNRVAYLLVSAEGNAYVAVFDRAKNVRFFNHLGLEKEPTENIVLIINNKHLWYPHMERDDTKKDANLRALAAAYTTDNPLPKLTKEEEYLVDILRETTGGKTRQDKQWMLVAAGRLHSRSWQWLNEIQKLYPRWSQVRRSHAPDLFPQELALIHRFSNRLSPAASHLAVQTAAIYAKRTGTSDHKRLDDTLDLLTRWYNSYMGVDSAMYPWWYNSELHFLNIDDSVFSKRANCIMISTNLAAVLDLAQLPELQTYQLFIPQHVLLLLTGANGYYSILDNNRFLSANDNYIPSPLRSVGFADGWIILQKHPECYGLKDVYTSYEPQIAENFIRTTLKDLSELDPHRPMHIAVFRDQDYGFDSQPYAVFLNKIDRGELKIKQWK